MSRPAVEASIRRTIGSTYQSLGSTTVPNPSSAAVVDLDSRTRPERSADPPRHEPPDLGAGRRGKVRRGRAAARRNLETVSRRWVRTTRPRSTRNLSLASCWSISASSTRPEGLSAMHWRASAGCWERSIEDTLRSINELGLLLQDRGKLDEADRWRSSTNMAFVACSAPSTRQRHRPGQPGSSALEPGPPRRG